MKRLFFVFAFIFNSLLIAQAQIYKDVLISSLNEMGFQLKTTDEIFYPGVFQGQFMQVKSNVEVLLIAKSPFEKDSTLPNIRLGYYSSSEPTRLRSLFESGFNENGKWLLRGLPAEPRGPYRFNAPQGMFGFYAQNSKYNPEYSTSGETVFTQDRLNKKNPRFKKDYHKVLIFPYKTASGVKKNWYVLCWELSNDRDYLDVVTVVRGVKILQPPPKPKKKSRKRKDSFNPLITFLKN